MKPTPEHLLELAYRCETSTDWLLGRDVAEAEILKEADVFFLNAIGGCSWRAWNPSWTSSDAAGQAGQAGMTARSL